ncbi:hypothetical protein [Deinococcus knuensis]|uniref:Phospholipase D-like domain-containing protein n=1 Tax=Deinococcus knuensis TaxID=1837380 RepID=A0ABQ2SPY4_9DEIO|nr:hypothetical protein [Deinococcus knuensis]GGS36555.1 hypothetical protein GCM10008961_30330 [Deinococcus knuensis]
MTTPFWGDWQDAFNGLRHEQGEWWIVTPFLTRTDLINEPSQTRVLTTLSNHKLATNDIQSAAQERTLDALSFLLEHNVEVRLLPDLHAKVYLRRTPAGAVGFHGSANLTSKALSNHEVMSGPVLFGSEFLEHLDVLWDRAKPLEHTHLQEARDQARQAREQLAAFAGLVPGVSVFVLDREYGLGSFALTNRRLRLPPNEQQNGYSPARVDFIHRDRTRAITQLVSRRIEQLRQPRRAAPPLATWLTHTTNMFAVRSDDVHQVRSALTSIQEEVQAASMKLARDNPELLTDFLHRLQTWMDDRSVDTSIQQEIEGDARDAYREVILGGEVQLRYSELAAQWPAVDHPWRPLFTAMVEQTQVPFLDSIVASSRSQQGNDSSPAQRETTAEGAPDERR